LKPRQTTVYIWLNGAFVPAGLLKFFEAGRRSYSIFRYGVKYLQRVDAQAVDPVQLPLSDDEISTPEGFDLFNGLRDAGPDRWGRYLIDRKIAAPLDAFDYICEASGDRSGALAFAPTLNALPVLAAM
jgi:serine/threonine-protein kinase HipA